MPDTPGHTDISTPAIRATAGRALTLQDLATHCGVSKWTVSRALRGDSSISPATTDRILAAAAALGYDPERHALARRLALQKSGRRVANRLLALAFPHFFFALSYFAEMYQGVLEVLTEAHYDLLTVRLPEGDGAELSPMFRRGEIDAVITTDIEEKLAPFITTLRDCPGFDDRPIVTINARNEGCSAIYVDDQHGAYLAATHLLERGHRHLLRMRHIHHDAHIEEPRAEGVRQAYLAFGLNPAEFIHEYVIDEQWIGMPPERLSMLVPPAWAEAPERHPFVIFLREHPEIHAVLAANDVSAHRAWYLLQHAGWQVPADISIVGFDDALPIHNMWGRNILTTVHVPLLELGRAAGRLALQQITNDSRPNEQRMLPVELIVRESTSAV